MSFLSSFQQFARDAGSSIQESAKKLVNNVVAETATASGASGASGDYPEDDATNFLGVEHKSLGMVKKNSSLNLHLPLANKNPNNASSSNNLLGVSVPTVVTSPATSPLRMMTTSEAIASRSREPSPQGRKFLGATNSGSFRRRSPAHHARRNSSLKGFDDRVFQVINVHSVGSI